MILPFVCVILREHMEGYRESCPQQMEQLCSEVDGLLRHLSQNLLDRFKTDVKVSECIRLLLFRSIILYSFQSFLFIIVEMNIVMVSL